MKKILFFNQWHIGDVFLVMSFIQNIVKNNPNIEFYYWCEEGHSFFKDINIKFASNFKKEDFQPFYNTVISNTDDFIFINTWIASFWADPEYRDLSVGECQILNKYPIFERICSKLNLNYTLQREDIFFEVPSANIELAIDWFDQNKNTKKIFYFNYLAGSGQIQPITNLAEHELVINTLAEKFNTWHILVPDNINPTKQNIINCQSQFNIRRTRTCEHLLQLHRIANMCEYAIYVDTGGCFLFANKKSFLSASQKILLTTGSSERYGRYLNEASNYVYKKDCVQQLHCNNVHEAVDNLTAILT